MAEGEIKVVFFLNVLASADLLLDTTGSWNKTQVEEGEGKVFVQGKGAGGADVQQR